MKKEQEPEEIKTEIEQESFDDEIIAKLEQENKELHEKLLRQMAETENVRHRNIKTVQETRDFAIVDFAKDLISVMDNLARAIEHLPKDLDEKGQNIVEGIKMTQDELSESFRKNGIEVIKPKIDEKFDYNLHCAISQQVVPDKEAGKIIDVMQVGYKIKDRLLRAASVVVSK